MKCELKTITYSSSETEDLGFKIGDSLKKIDERACILIYGDLGAGKTTFIKGVASAFGISPRDIGSASFVIIAEYNTFPPFYHIDLYRIENERDIELLGIWEYLESGVSVVEWAERLKEIPEPSIKVRIRYIDENTREITIEGVPNSLCKELG